MTGTDLQPPEILDGEGVVAGLPAVRAHDAMVTRAEVTVDEVVAQRDKVKAVMERVMRPEVHYGHIPGVAKPTLFKPGAEVLNTTFRLAPSYQSERIFDGDHLTVVSKCVLTHAPSGIVLGEGEGLCSTREAKYAYRTASRVCPVCGAAAIIKGKDDYGGGWLCWKKRDGCGAKFRDGDPAIETQETGKVANEELPDTWNTVLKMADKRALVAAVLNCTAASDIFTQDVEDQPAAPEATGEAASDVAAASSAPSSRDVDADAGPRFESPVERPATQAQCKKLDVLYGKMKDRNLADQVVAAAGGDRGDWAAARDALTVESASVLIRRIENFLVNDAEMPA